MPGGKPIKKPVSEAQRRFFGAELGRLRAGKKTQTGISEQELSVKATKPKGKKLPGKVGKGQSMPAAGGMAPGPVAPAPVPRRRGVPAATVPTLRGRPAPAGGMAKTPLRRRPAVAAGAPPAVPPRRRGAPLPPPR